MSERNANRRIRQPICFSSTTTADLGMRGIFFTCLAMLSFCGSLSAQTRTIDEDSHRILKLPGNPNTDIRLQMEALRGLSRFIDEKQARQAESFLQDQNPDELQALSEMLNLLGNGRSNNFDTLAEKFASDPEIRSRAQELLRKYMQERRLPPFRPGSQGFPSPPRERFSNDRDQTRQDYSSNGLRLPPGRSSNDQSSSGNEALSGSQRNELLRQIARQYEQQRNEQQSSFQPIPSLTDLLEQARRGRSSLPESSRSSASETNNLSTIEANRDSSNGSSPAQSIDPKQLGNIARSFKDAMPDRLEKRLDQSGVSKLLKDFMQESKSEVRQQASTLASDGSRSSSGQLAGWDAAVIEAVSEVFSGVGEIAKDFKDKARQEQKQRSAKSSSNSSNSSQAQVSKPSSGAGGSKSDTGQNANKSASTNLFTNRAKPKEKQSSEGNSESAKGASGLQGISVPAELLVAVVLLAAVGTYYFFSSFRSQQTEKQNASSRMNEGLAILTRHDVVQAFHSITERCLEPGQHWWTHRKAVSSLGDKQPDWELALRRLADIYEHARYLPSEISLTEEELRAAQRAWDHCNA